MRVSLSTNSFLQRVILLANNFAVMANSCYCLKCHWNFWRESFFTLFKMEKFLTTKSKPKKEQHLPVNITASERARQYQRGTFHASENLLFCSTCNVVVDHLRKYVVDRHLQSSSHQVKAERKDLKGRALLFFFINYCLTVNCTFQEYDANDVWICL